MRRAFTWMLTAPIGLAGAEAAHAIANCVLAPPQVAGELFESRGAGSELLPAVAATLGAVLLLALVGRVLEIGGSHRGDSLGRLRLTLVGPVAFVLIEAVEGACRGQIAPWDVALEPTFLLGLVLLVPFAVLGYLVAVALARTADAAARLVRDRVRTGPRRNPPEAGWPRLNVARMRPRWAPCAVRGPPAAVTPG